MANEKIKLGHKGWVVVADGGKALFLQNKGNEHHPELIVFRVDENDNPPDREQVSDRPGRFSDGGSGHKSAAEKTDWHELAEQQFASDLAERLYDHAHKGHFKSLVLVASPSTLGDIRRELHEEVTARIVGEIDKDFTNHPIEEIEKIVLN